MIMFIKQYNHTIPFAILLSTLAITFILFSLAGKRIGLTEWYYFLLRILAVTAVSFLMYRVHIMTLPLYIEKTNLQILLIFLPGLLLVGAAGILILYKTGRLQRLIEQISARWKK